VKSQHTQIALNDVDWRVIKSPIECYAFSVFAPAATNLKLRTDAADPTTEIIVFSMQEHIFNTVSSKNSRIQHDEILGYGQLVAGSVSISAISRD